MTSDKFKPTLEALAKQSAVYTKEAPLRVNEHGISLSIGIPKEIELQEKRICLTPESVGLLVNNGHQVMIESGAGLDAGFTDHMFSDKGGQIVYSHQDVFQTDIVLKVEPPTKDEIHSMHQGGTLISAVQMAKLSEEYLQHLNKKKITAVGFEFIEDKGGQKPIIRTISEIASNCILSIASQYLSKPENGMGVILGGVTGVSPIKIVILGAGTIGVNVARAARALGAQVVVFDNHHYKLRRLKTEIGEQVYTAIIDASTLSKELLDADVVIGALRSEEGTSLCVVTEEMVANMKPKSLIIDASISQGGCFETSRLTSHDEPIYISNDVIHYCVPNISSRVSQTATKAFSYIFAPMILQIGRLGGVEDMMARKDWFMKGVYTYKGCLTNAHIARKFQLQHKDLSLLLAAHL